MASNRLKTAESIRFADDFELDLRAYELRRSGRPLKLERIPMELLMLLIERRGELVTREQIIERIWGKDVFLDTESGINAGIRKIRQVLKDDPERPRFVQTVTGKGYRFIAPIEEPGKPQPHPSLVIDDRFPPTENLLGKKIAHYRVLQLLGGGGMGVVYKAEDLKLGRQVALKFLPAELARDPVAFQRLEQEARAASALDHPNICSIYQLGEHEGQPFIVMQLLEGQTLREWIAAMATRDPDSQAKDLVDLAIQITDGLAAAHQKGIIHRDIKPANIFITGQGQAKILDFGVAKFMDAAASTEESGGAEIAGESSAATKAGIHLTQTGVSFGTPSYLSPEQIRREKLDARTDLFSFGLVLYEMATGQRAYSGNTATVIRDAVLNLPIIPPRQLDSSLSPELQRIITKSLEKDRDRRYQSATELCTDLRRLTNALPGAPVENASTFDASQAVASSSNVAEESAGIIELLATAGVVPDHRATRRLLPWAVVAVGVLAAGLALWRWWPTRPAAPVVTRFTISLPTSDQFSMPRGGLAISPDGGYLVYSATAKTGGHQLYLRPMDRNEAALIPGTEGAMGPFFSPDGEWIAFTARGQLKKVPLHGGTPIALCPKANPNPGSWGPDGTIVFADTQDATGNVNGRLMRVTAAGRDLQVVTPPEKTPAEFYPRWPQVLPRGDAILYVTGGTSAAFSDDAMIVAQSLRTGERKTLIQGGTSPRYLSTGHLIYAQGGRLLAIRFDAARLEVMGTAFPVVEDVWQGPGGYAAYDVSRNGTLVSLSAGDRGVGNRTLTWVDPTGTPLPINATARQYSQPSLSRDGKHIAVVIGDPLRQADIWILDLEQKTVRQITESQPGESAAAPLWTADGKRIIYAAGTHGRSLYWRAADGNSAPELLFTGDHIDPPAGGMILATSCSPDGRVLIFQRGDFRHFDLWVLSLSGEHKASPLLASAFDTFDTTYPQMSPDGRRLAYTSNESGREEVYVQPFPALGDKWRVSVEGGEEPRWSRDGHQLFFRHGDKMMTVDVQTKSTFKGQHAHLLFEGPYARSDFWTNYDVADGQRFVMFKEEDEARASQVLRVVLNWTDELKSYSRRGKN